MQCLDSMFLTYKVGLSTSTILGEIPHPCWFHERGIIKEPAHKAPAKGLLRLHIAKRWKHIDGFALPSKNQGHCVGVQVRFYPGVCLLNPCSVRGHEH